MANISADNKTGTIIGYLAGTSQGFVVNFKLNPDGTFSAPAAAFTGNTSGATGAIRTIESTLGRRGIVPASIKSVLMTLTGGAFPRDGNHGEEDANEWKEFGSEDFPTEKVGLSKVDAVYLSGNKTRDDIPQHLLIGKDIPANVADFYASMCPAGVYERRGDTLVVNAPNCVDCKASGASLRFMKVSP